MTRVISILFVIAFAVFPVVPGVAFAAVNELDSDEDGISDVKELVMGTQPGNPDSDGDGYPDNHEISNGYDPLDPRPIKARKSIRVHLKTQTLDYSLGKAVIGHFRISSGKKSLPTPTGTFSIINKDPRAWSKLAGLWMPYWMGFKGGKFGIHELPEWPGGKKEGANHLGKPVSHGCIRLGIGDAKTLYNWAPIGTPLTITQ
ncbi:MAG: L,D-transpeptidase family protein [bacterium]|nr:L,D-transpeptidase family protein [bacterium]